MIQHRVWLRLGNGESSSENWNLAVSNSRLVSPEEAQRLLRAGYTYVDVRSELEFSLGHVPGAFNVPLQRVEGDRLVDNSDFASVMMACFRTTDPLIIGCRSGSRSRVAVARLSELGFVDLAELEHGFLGARDDFGRRLPGWAQSGLAVEDKADGARQYEQLRASRAPRASGGSGGDDDER
jgi:rhodanese-related sulfurtransferase